MNDKIIVIINGKGTAGKDTLVETGANSFSKHHGEVKVLNISSIDTIYEVAKLLGWDGTKNDSARLFLSELKAASTNFNDYINEYCMTQAKQFFEDPIYGIMFIHVREPEEIEKLKRSLQFAGKFKVLTLLIRRDEADEKEFGNSSDDGVFGYEYDYIFDNNMPEEESHIVFNDFVDGLLKGEK